MKLSLSDEIAILSSYGLSRHELCLLGLEWETLEDLANFHLIPEEYEDPPDVASSINRLFRQNEANLPHTHKPSASKSQENTFNIDRIGRKLISKGKGSLDLSNANPIISGEGLLFQSQLTEITDNDVTIDVFADGDDEVAFERDSSSEDADSAGVNYSHDQSRKRYKAANRELGSRGARQ